MSYQYDDSGQRMFDYQMSFLGKALRYLFSAFLLSPVLIAGLIIAYLTLAGVDMQENMPLLTLLTVCFSYLVYSFIFFLKGLMLALKSNKSPYWMLLYLLCVVIATSLPLFFTYQLFSPLIKKNPGSEQEYIIWGIIMGGIVSYLAYRKYDFLTDVAPKWVFWAYNSGFKAARSTIASPNEDVADISQNQIL